VRAVHSVAREEPLAGTALAVLTLINLFNYLDRWIVAALAESMKHSELRLSDTQLGALMTGFLVVYMLAAPLFGSLGDTRSRTRLIGLGVAVWRAATALGGLARNRPSLLPVLGYAAYTFAIGALAFWTPSFLERARGIPKAQATVQFGAIVVVTGFLGTYGGGWLGDRLLRRSRQAYLWVSGV